MIPNLSEILLIIPLISVVQVKSHGRVMEPVMRSSIWRLPEYSDRHPPVNYDDNALYCGGYAVSNNPIIVIMLVLHFVFYNLICSIITKQIKENVASVGIHSTRNNPEIMKKVGFTTKALL